MKKTSEKYWWRKRQQSEKVKGDLSRWNSVSYFTRLSVVTLYRYLSCRCKYNLWYINSVLFCITIDKSPNKALFLIILPDRMIIPKHIHAYLAIKMSNNRISNGNQKRNNKNGKRLRSSWKRYENDSFLFVHWFWVFSIQYSVFSTQFVLIFLEVLNALI